MKAPPGPREHLRAGVEEALVTLGQGFLTHPENRTLRALLQSGGLGAKDYMTELLRLVYRLVFLLTVEERGLLDAGGAGHKAAGLYAEDYSMRRLRDRSLERSAHDSSCDLWDALNIVFRGLSNGEPRLGLPALGGIFATTQASALDAAKLENGALLLAVSKLCWLGDDAGLAPVNWREMGPEELGSVYESLLELVPEITSDGRQFTFASGGEIQGNARRTTGSYYTPDSLVQVLLDNALEPVIAETLAMNPEQPVEALLGLSIVDPACGSGHFLLAAARRLAGHVARLQADGPPSAAEFRHALRQVVGRCIYGVDLNPVAVELCKVSLWMEAVEPGLPLTFLDSHIQHGNALLGATPELMAQGIPDAAWEPAPGDDKKTASALKKRNRKHADEAQTAWSFGSEEARDPTVVSEAQMDTDGYQRFLADAWCAAFVWPKEPGEMADTAPTNELWRRVREGQERPPTPTVETTEELAKQYCFLHWHLAFPQVFARGRFDVVLGNPPWVAHAGRAAQPLPPRVKRFFEYNFESFADYPTTHGMFVTVAARIARFSGRIGLVVPSSLSELGGYAPTRRAHDRLCQFTSDLVDFGEGRFPGVTQPCMALVSQRVPGGRKDAPPGDPWPVERPDLTATDRRLLARLASLSPVPAQLFGERGVQSDKSLSEHFLLSPQPAGRFTTPIREGTDVREFELFAPRYHVDPRGLGNRIRSAEEFKRVRVLIRQTARYPIAALSDGVAFRNSLLAGLDQPGWEPAALTALLNSALVRWLHYMRFRDARQPVMPQVKIAHLRSIPLPPAGFSERVGDLASLGRRLSETRGSPDAARARAELDRLVAELYGLSPEETATVARWHDETGPGCNGRR